MIKIDPNFLVNQINKIQATKHFLKNLICYLASHPLECSASDCSYWWQTTLISTWKVLIRSNLPQIVYVTGIFQVERQQHFNS